MRPESNPNPSNQRNFTPVKNGARLITLSNELNFEPDLLTPKLGSPQN